MKSIKKIIVMIGLCFTHLYAQNQSKQQLSQQDQTALELIGAMQQSITISIESQAKPITPNITQQENLIKEQFSKYLDKYLTQFGQVYEKQGGLIHAYRNIFHIASRNNKDLAITPNKYNLLLETLQQALNHTDWGSTINLELSVNKNGLLSQKNLKLYEIVAAIKQVPLPANYSMTSILVGTAAVAAIAAGAYFATSSLPTPTTMPETSTTNNSSNNPAQNTPPSPTNTPEPVKVQPKKKQLFEKGLQRYVDIVTANPELDNPLAADNYITPDEMDAIIAHPVTETMMLPFDVKNRLEITHQNLQNPNFKLGTTIDTSLEKIHQFNSEEGNAYLEADYGDLSLGHTVSNLGVARMYAPTFKGIRPIKDAVTQLRTTANYKTPPTKTSTISQAGMVPIEAPQPNSSIKMQNSRISSPKSDSSLITTTEITGHAALESSHLKPNSPGAAALRWTGPAAYPA